MRWVFMTTVAVLILAAGPAWAEDPPAADTETPAAEIDETATPAEETEEATPAIDPQRLQDQIDAVRSDVDSILGVIGKITFYGHLKLDSSRDTAETNFGLTAFFVQDYAAGEKDEEVNISARHTRLGMRWRPPEFEGIEPYGNIEIDFIGKSVQKTTETQELQAAPRMRHAFAKFTLPDGWVVLFGQTWDVFGPHNMKKLNTLVGWGQGNIAFRRPQLRVVKNVKTGDGVGVSLKFAIARPVAKDTGKDSDLNDDGEDSGVPDLQAHVGIKVPVQEKKPVALGVGGFYGWREVDGPVLKENAPPAPPTVLLPSDDRYRSWAVAADVLIPVVPQLEIIGEWWYGVALDGYRAGVWQSYVRHNGKVRTIRAMGYWVNFVMKPVKKVRIVAGYGVDNPKDADFHGQEGRRQNKTLFGNVMYTFWKGGTVGVEYDRMETDYLHHSDRINHRVQVSFMQKFGGK